MDVYKKIQKELDKGKTVLIDVTSTVELKERFRLLTKKSAQFDWFNSRSMFLNNCCWHKKTFVNCKTMKNFDRDVKLKITKWQVLD